MSADGSALHRWPLDALRGLDPFTRLPQPHLREACANGRLVRAEQGRVLFKRNAPGDVLRYLLAGAVDLADAGYKITHLRAGEARARYALDDCDPHRVAAVTTEPVQIFETSRGALDLVLGRQQAGEYRVTELAAEAWEDGDDWMAALLRSRLFAVVPPAKIQQLFARFESLDVDAGCQVVAQGEVGEYFYVIKRGRARVTRVERGRSVRLRELGPGGFFGEDALVGDAPRSATVTMLESGTLMRLADTHFQQLLEAPVLDYVTPEEVDTLRAAAPALAIIDVRTAPEFAAHGRPASRNLPLERLRGHLGALDPRAVYVVTCGGGRRSCVAAHLMRQRGLDARVLAEPDRGGTRRPGAADEDGSAGAEERGVTHG